MRKKLLFLPVITLLLLGIAIAQPTRSFAATEASVELIYANTGVHQSGSALVKNGVAYLPDYLITSTAGLNLSWDKAHKRAEFTGWEKNFAVRVGSRTGFLDGRVVDLGGTPFISMDQLYVPARFVLSALDGESLKWNANSKRLTATGLHRYGIYSATYSGATYTVVQESGDLFVSFKKNTKSKIGNIGAGLDFVNFAFKHTPGGLIVLSINNYTDPHVYNTYSTFLLQKGNGIRQASIHLLVHYPAPPLWYEGKLVFNDGQTLRLIEDGTGKVIETIDLVKLMKPDADDATTITYNVEALFPDYALIRSSNTGALTLVNRTTGEQTLLYKVFPDIIQQVGPGDRNPLLSLYDHIQFIGREGNVLTFEYWTAKDLVIKIFTLPAAKP